MKLLIVTQTVDTDNPILGFFVRWIEEFAKHCEKIAVICLHEGEYTLPSNVEVYEIGKAVSRRQYDLFLLHGSCATNMTPSSCT